MADQVIEQPKETAAPPPLVETSPIVASESRGLRVIQAGDAEEAAKALDARAKDIRPNEKVKISAPLVEAPKAEEPPADAAPAEPKKPKALQPGGERFEEAQRQKRELHAENEKLKAEIAALKAPKPPVAAAPPVEGRVEPPAIEAKPFVTQAEYFAAHPDKVFEDFLNARDAHNRAEWQRVDTETRQRQEATQRAQSDLQRYITAAAEIENFDQIINEGLAKIPFNPYLQQAVLQSEDNAKLAHYLATHPTEAAALAQLPVAEMYRGLGRLEVQLRSPRVGTTETVRRSSAPPPYEPTGGSATSQTTEDFFESAERISKMKGGTIAAYEQMRKARGMSGGRRRM